MNGLMALATLRGGVQALGIELGQHFLGTPRLRQEADEYN
jgi:hypothetical protein